MAEASCRQGPGSQWAIEPEMMMMNPISAETNERKKIFNTSFFTIQIKNWKMKIMLMESMSHELYCPMLLKRRGPGGDEACIASLTQMPTSPSRGGPCYYKRGNGDRALTV